MARVIKGNKANLDNSKVVIASPTATSGGRIIEREIYEAQQQARAILEQGEIDKKKRLADGKKSAVQAKDNAMLASASEAFAAAAKEALAIFKNKGDQSQNIPEIVKRISSEIISKILGEASQLESSQINAIINIHVQKLRSRRRIKLVFAKDSIPKLSFNIIPELELADSSDVSLHMVRVETEVGHAVCDESFIVQTLNELFGVGEIQHEA